MYNHKKYLPKISPENDQLASKNVLIITYFFKTTITTSNANQFIIGASFQILNDISQINSARLIVYKK